MRLKLMEPIELDGIDHAAGKVLEVPSAVGVDMLQNHIAVPVPPQHARQVIQPEEEREQDEAKKPNRINRHA